MSEAVRVIYLGNAHASDDSAALVVSESVDAGESIRAGRPGVGLVDLLDGSAPIVLVDVTHSGAPAGTIHRMTMAELDEVVRARASVSSHDFGPGEALELRRALGRPLPRGHFVGVEGRCFYPGDELSPEVKEALPRLAEAVRAAVVELSQSEGAGA